MMKAKHLLFYGIAALVLCIFFISCTESYDQYSGEAYPRSCGLNLALATACLAENFDEFAVSAEVTIEDLIELVWIAGGTFTMGSPANEPGRRDNEGPQHTVTVSGFYMAKHPITQEQWAVVMGADHGFFRGADHPPAPGEIQGRRPADSVSWYNAIVFSNRLSILRGRTPVYSINGSTNPDNWGTLPTGNNPAWNRVAVNWNADGYRLPTEAEWEFACRAGTTTAYNTGNTISADDAWFWPHSNRMTRQTGLLPANAWGLYDMHGNVWEWVWDRFGDYTADAKTDPRGPNSGVSRVIRGGSWYNDAADLRSALRLHVNPWNGFHFYGFRVVRSRQSTE